MASLITNMCVTCRQGLKSAAESKNRYGTHECKYTLLPAAVTTTANLAEALLFGRVLAGTGLSAHEQATRE